MAKTKVVPNGPPMKTVFNVKTGDAAVVASVDAAEFVATGGWTYTDPNAEAVTDDESAEAGEDESAEAGEDTDTPVTGGSPAFDPDEE